MSAAPRLENRLAYSATDLMALLPIRRSAAYRLARQLGRRVGRRLMVSRVALEAWLATTDDADVPPLARRQ